ncbi:SpoIVB peptidase S55 domain-containing protein [Dendrosporobacter sp. 1207_IL3150]
MLKLFKRCLAALLMLIVLPTAIANAAAGFLPVDKIKPGMNGIAKTVVNGTKIEEFGVEVLGIMKNKGPSGDLILVRTYGDVINRTGGIVQGMSGSPVYFDGQLAGAIAYGWPLSDHKIGMVTPIGDMLKLWEAPDKVNNRVFEQIDLSEDINLFENIDKPAEEAVPVATPLMASGFTEQALKMLTDKLKPLNMVPYSVGGAPSDTDFGAIEPGSAVGVELVRGDISLSALGTATYVENGKVLAFGHPFLKKGNTGYFMTNAYIFTAVDGLESGFKVGATGEAIGLINQDRGAGIAGQLNKFPSVIPVRIKVSDQQLGVNQDYAVQVVHDDQLGPALAATVAFNAIDKTIDRVGPGTAKVSFEIMARGMPGDVIKRDNMFYSAGSIGELSVAEFFEAMNMIANNKFNSVDIMDVKINVDLTEERRTASITEARSAVATARPGETISLTVKLKPFRGETVTRIVPFVIPKNQPAGPLMLQVRGGGLVPLTQLLLKQQGIDLSKNQDRQKSFADILKEFQNGPRNNDIVVEIMDMNIGNMLEQTGGDSPIEPKKATKANPSKTVKPAVAIGAAADSKEAAKTNFATDYIIDNDTQVIINIVNP